MHTTAILSAWPDDERDRKRAPARFWQPATGSAPARACWLLPGSAFPARHTTFTRTLLHNPARLNLLSAGFVLHMEPASV